MTPEPIVVWKYYEAPKELQVSNNGGDEDWLAEVPPQFENGHVGWLDDGSAFGRCCVDVHPHPLKIGWKIHIGCHA